MRKSVEFGIGFISGRPNVCKIINSYYKDILNQLDRYKTNVNLTIYILYDLDYQKTKVEDYHKILPEVKNNIKIKYVDEKCIKEEKEKLINENGLAKNEIDLLFGKGYAKSRNAIMYFALKDNIDYLMFWDDDEYPLANIKNDNKEIEWVKQDNLLTHLNNIENAEVTMGYRCGIMSPIPYVELKNQEQEEDFKMYIDAISNEAVSWEKIKTRLKNDNMITYADPEVLERKEAVKMEGVGVDNWLLASGICINLRHIDKIPAFYNPPNARGEDAFFSTWLKNESVLRVPTYHFHDGFLKYTDLMDKKYPKKLKKTENNDISVEKRFLQASIGWMKYKPLLIYITDKEIYSQRLDIIRKKLEYSIPKMNQMFKNVDFSVLLEELDTYNMSVEKDYEEYVKTNEIWKKVRDINKKFCM